MSKVYLASDHAGFELKNALVAYLQTLGYQIEDLGAHTLDPEDDYPDYVTPCAKLVATDETSFGLVLGKSGQGEAMCANRIPGVRAAVFYGGETELIKLEREHNNANVLSLGAAFLSVEEARAGAKLFLETPFSNAERHIRRLAKF